MIECQNLNCRENRSMPLKSSIALYWSRHEEELGKFIDWGEPTCWGCGYFESDNDIVSTQASLTDIMKCWNKQSYLERAHIIPKGLSGCNCESNLVLLCHQCHKENPDTDNRKYFFKWLNNRMSYSDRELHRIKIGFLEQGMELNSLDFFLLQTEKFQEVLKEKAIQVRGRYTIASKLAALQEWKSDFSEKQLMDFLPKSIKDTILDVNKNTIGNNA